MNREFEIPFLGAIARKQVFGEESQAADDEGEDPKV
jgi:hypothetical protein